jgi:MarR family transcriptional regulator, temperature-dependent positive regulator of motility
MCQSIPDEIPFGAVLTIVTRERFIFLNERLRPLGLTFGQFPVLMRLSHEQNIMQENLVRHFFLDKGTIARAARKLEAAGYISRIVDPDDRRAVRIFLTEKGEEIIPRLRAIEKEWARRVSNGLSAEEREQAESLMRRIARNSHMTIQNIGDQVHADE